MRATGTWQTQPKAALAVLGRSVRVEAGAVTTFLSPPTFSTSTPRVKSATKT